MILGIKKAHRGGGQNTDKKNSPAAAEVNFYRDLTMQFDKFDNYC